MRTFDVATIQTATNQFDRRAIVAPRNDEGTVLLDMCPKGTMDVHTFKTKAAAEAFAKPFAVQYTQYKSVQGEHTNQYKQRRFNNASAARSFADKLKSRSDVTDVRIA